MHAEIRRGDLEGATRARAGLLEDQRDALALVHAVRDAGFFLRLELGREVEQLRDLRGGEVEQLQKVSSPE